MMRYDRIGRELAKAYFFGTGFRRRTCPAAASRFLKSRADLGPAGYSNCC